MGVSGDDRGDEDRGVSAGVREQDLPACVRDALGDARATRPDADIECLTFHTREGDRVVASMGPEPRAILGLAGQTAPRVSPKDVLVLSVAVTETTFAKVHVVTHVLITIARPRSRRAS